MSQHNIVTFQMTPPAVPEPYAAAGLSLSQLRHILRVYWRTSIKIALLVILLATALTLMLPKTYTATATLIVNYEVNDPLGGKEFPVELLGSYMATQVELLRSPTVLLPVIDRLNLNRNRHYTSGYFGSPEGLREWIELQLERKLEVTQGTAGGQIIYVSFSASDPAEAAQIANVVVDIYLEQVSERVSGPANEHARRYTEQLDELKAKVSHAQEEVTRFRQQNGLIDEHGQALDEVAVLGAMEQRLTDAKAARRAAEARVNSNAALSDGVLSSSLVQTLRSQLAVQQAHMAELRSSLGPRHPELLQLQSQIDATQAALNSEIQRYAVGAGDDLRAARELEQQLSAAVEQQRTRALVMQRLQDQAANLQLELDSAEAVYKRALEGYDQVLAASSGRYTNSSVAARALPPVKASKPHVLRNVAGGALLGLLLGFGGALLYELFNRRIRCRDDMERAYGIPVLAEFAPLPAIRSIA